MAETTNIEWADKSWSPWTGCMKVSPACDGCYAEFLMDTRMHRASWGAPGKGVGDRSRMSASYWKKPIAWDREAKRAGERPTVFPSLCDPFDNAVDLEWFCDFLILIKATPNLTWLLLTKRPGNIIARLKAAMQYMGFEEPLAQFWPRNAAIGCTMVTQAEFERDGGTMAIAKAALKPAFAFASIEPMLEEMDVTLGLETGTFDWIIVGGETTQGSHQARPMHPAWVRRIRDACSKFGTDFLFKQWGSFAHEGQHDFEATRQDVGYWRKYIKDGRVIEWPDGLWSIRMEKGLTGRMLDGRTHDARPEVSR